MHEGKWNGLGGKLQSGETPEECVIREVKEESGLTIKNPQLKGFITFPAFPTGSFGDESDDWYVFIYVATEFEGELIDSYEGKLAWIDDSELLSLHLWDGDKIFLPWLNQNKFFSAKFIYDKGNLVDYNTVFYDLV